MPKELSRPICAVECPILNCLAEMARLKTFRRVQIRNRAGDFQNTVVGARRKAKARDRVLQHFFAFVANRAEFPNHFWRHVRVGKNLFLRRVASRLNRPCPAHAFANRGGVLGIALGAQFLIFYGWNFDVNVDSVDQRTGNFRDVTLNLRRRAVALARGISKESARLRVTSLLKNNSSIYL